MPKASESVDAAVDAAVGNATTQINTNTSKIPKRAHIDSSGRSPTTGVKAYRQGMSQDGQTKPSPLLQRRPTLTSAGTRTKHLLRSKLKRKHKRDVPPTESFADELPVRKTNTLVELDHWEVLQAALAHTKGIALSSNNMDNPFPEYDDLQLYSVLEEVSLVFLDKEIKRLTEVIAHPKKALRFSGQTYLKHGSRDGYKNLSTLSNTLMKAVRICHLDNAAIDAQFLPQLSGRGKIDSHMRAVRSGMRANGVDPEAEESTGTGNEDSYTEACFALVEFVTEVYVRLIIQSGDGKYWHNNMVGVAAKWAAKAKFILLDLQLCSSLSLSFAETIIDGMEDNPSSAKEDEAEDCEELWENINARAKGQQSAEDIAVEEHCLHQHKFRTGIGQFLKYVLLSLQHLNRSGFPVSTYEVCAVVYDTGFEGFKSLLFQDRDHEFTATSDLSGLNVAHGAFSLLHQTLEEIEAETTPEPPNAANCSTMVHWWYDEETNGSPGEVSQKDENRTSYAQRPPTDTHGLTLSCMEDIVSAMVLLAAASPVASANMNSFRDMVALTADVEDHVRPYAETPFNAFFRMYTSDYEKRAITTRRDVLGLSDAVDKHLFSRDTLITSARLEPGPSTNTSSMRKENSQKWHRLISEMDEWIMDENTVTVNCGPYVAIVLGAAALLVAGGLALGFAVGDRIKGVDPFNMTTYAWVLAAFFILVCKSTKVDTWSWRDFLLGRVKCRSVSELQSVTGINDQVIMAKLLHDEKRAVLTTRGPFNSVFTRKSQDGSGFSIDCPITTRTMLLSGLTLLKVVTPQGYALVCLDARRGTDLEVVEHRGLDSKERLVCEDLHPRRQKGKTSQFSCRLSLEKTKIRWKQVQGVYQDLDAVFE